MGKGFVETPFLPLGKVTDVLLDCRVEDEIINSLNAKGINVIKTITCGDLYEAVHSHPDIVLHPIGDKSIIVAPNVFNYYHKKLAPLGINVIRGNTVLKSHYPHNIAYNICRVGNYAIHNFKFTDETITNYIEKKGLTKIQVSQGYAKCSIAVVGKKAIITTDVGIHREVIKYGIDVLLIEEGDILLPGLNYGFIGGSCGFIDQNTLAFFGDLEQYKNYQQIIKFFKKHNKNAVSLSCGQLKDYGTLVPLIEMD
ncbi:MAG: hypothetical protein JJT76_04505 [Clostridiaceae bacterium]|nr:hypothetical protein [Clostridiaceae bacterium]